MVSGGWIRIPRTLPPADTLVARVTKSASNCAELGLLPSRRCMKPRWCSFSMTTRTVVPAFLCTCRSTQIVQPRWEGHVAWEGVDLPAWAASQPSAVQASRWSWSQPERQQSLISCRVHSRRPAVRQAAVASWSGSTLQMLTHSGDESRGLRTSPPPKTAVTLHQRTAAAEVFAAQNAAAALASLDSRPLQAPAGQR